MPALKEKRITKRQLNPGIWLMFLSRSTERQAGHDVFLLVLKKLNLPIFLRIFFFVYLFSQNVNFVHI